MDRTEVVEFIHQHHRAILLTRRRDGSAQLSPIVAAVDTDGRVVVSSRETAMKVKNTRRDGNVSLCVFSDDFFGPWIQVDGTAEVLSLPGAMDALVGYYRLVSGEHPDWDEYRAAMTSEKRVLLAITVTRAGPDLSG
ncbi:MAG: PPOX class F420-dependent oxidoreductase [Acidimicrobiales bacterium]